MVTTHILFNPISGNNNGKEKAETIEKIYPSDKFTYSDITQISNIRSFIEYAPAEDKIVIAGGDGTLNHFVNDIGDDDIARDVFYYATGTGNDFLVDVNSGDAGRLVKLNDYICGLPTVTVNGKKRKFINGVGYGIDGYCCETGDKQRETSDKPVNYTAIAIKGLLFRYKPVNAKITVDGVEHTYKKVWLAPTMNGRYYGGGMLVAPEQSRLNKERTLSVVVMHGSGKIKTLFVFPSIFKGGHVAHTEMVEVLEGHEIEIEFDRPTALQIDGETVVGVTKCSSHSMTERVPQAV